jgi:hypothetical protein
VIDEAYLIPDFIAPSEPEKAWQTCPECGRYRDENRKYVRLRKPVKAILRRETEGAPAEGQVVNVSGVGALVVLSRIMHEPPAATADMAVLPGVLGSHTLRRTEKHASGPSPSGCPVARPSPRSHDGVSRIMRASEWVKFPAGELLHVKYFSRLESTERSSRGILKAVGRVNRVAKK